MPKNQWTITNKPLSWGRTIREPQSYYIPNEPFEVGQTLFHRKGKFLPRGRGMSYGDCGLIAEGTLVDTSNLDQILSFDPTAGILRVESGCTVQQLLECIVPYGWFLPVTPGTKFATVGGCIANDVHGKNHVYRGTFGHHVRAIKLVRSNGEDKLLTNSSDWFRATVGGLGLTGFIEWAELDLIKIPSPILKRKKICLPKLNKLYETLEQTEEFEYSVGWLDLLNGAKGTATFAKFVPDEAAPSLPPQSLKFEFPLPIRSLYSISLKWFNHWYYNHQKLGTHYCHLYDFFYPLDRIAHWNKLYGRKGFYQNQFLIPRKSSDSLTELLTMISAAKERPYLAVAKVFGKKNSRGWLSFPTEGISIALDYPNLGNSTLKWFDRLDKEIINLGGRLYPAKDARMSHKTFRSSYPEWEKLLPFIDPKFSSRFWNRVNE